MPKERTPTARDDAKNRMLGAGLGLLFDHGYEDTGVQQITAASKVPKGSFYYYFGSKEAFALAVADRYLDSMLRMLDRHLISDTRSPLERLDHLLATWTDQLAQGGFRRGCLAGTLCQEMAAKNTAFQQKLDRVFAAMQRGFTACLDAAQEVGEIDGHHDTDVLAEFVLNGWQGAMLRMKASRSRTPLERFRHVLFTRVLT